MNLQISRARLLLSALVLTLWTGWVCADEVLQISAPIARPTPPNATVGAVFLTLTAAKPDRLLAARTEVAQSVELHSISMEDGMMRMRLVKELPLPAGKPVQLSPTGMHLMLIGLEKPLVAGTRFALTLRFEQAGERTVTVSVEPLGSTDSHEHHH